MPGQLCLFRIMGLENSEEWMNQIQHGELIIKRARAFFDSWLERFSTWEDFVQGVRNNPLPEFGQSADAAINQVTDWLGGAAKAAANYTYIVKYGVGSPILHRFTGVREATIKAALLALGRFLIPGWSSSAVGTFLCRLSDRRACLNLGKVLTPRLPR